MAGCPSWSKGPDSSSGISNDAWVRIPLLLFNRHKLYYILPQFINRMRVVIKGKEKKVIILATYKDRKDLKLIMEKVFTVC